MTRLVCKRIAIIGAGPSGLSAAKYLLAEKAFDTIDVYEQRAIAGGLWSNTPDLTTDNHLRVPQVNPFGPLDAPDKSHEELTRFLSPIYDTLETNIPHVLMQYADRPFPRETQLFPKHDEVESYLLAYAEDVKHLIKYKTQVTKVSLVESAHQSSWDLRSTFLPTGDHSCLRYDAIVVANGHYTIPFLPAIPGIESWSRKYPNSISHAKYYRRPEPFAGKRVIIVGNSASGLDIGSQILKHCAQPMFMSTKSASYLASGFPGLENGVVTKPPIARFDDDAVVFNDGSSEKVDRVVFCTGYFYSFPFLPSLVRHSTHPLLDTGKRVCNSYKHLFYNLHPTLAFMALNKRIIPFPLAEAQSAVLARVYSGKLELPSQAEMEAWEAEKLKALEADGKDPAEFHTLNFPKDAEYINELCEWAAAAGEGKAAQRWGPWHYWARERFPQIRRAFVEKGEQRSGTTSLEDVGFDYEAFLREKQEEGRQL